MADRAPITRQGYQALEAELKRLKVEERPRIARELEEARAHGDISENAEFEAAKHKQALSESRIRQLEDRLARAQVIEPKGEPPESVHFGVTVVLMDSESGEEITYTIVGEDESDATNGRISITSPVARALLGRGIDDSVTVRVPRGTRELTVLALRYE